MRWILQGVTPLNSVVCTHVIGLKAVWGLDLLSYERKYENIKEPRVMLLHREYVMLRSMLLLVIPSPFCLWDSLFWISFFEKSRWISEQLAKSWQLFCWKSDVRSLYQKEWYLSHLLPWIVMKMVLLYTVNGAVEVNLSLSRAVLGYWGCWNKVQPRRMLVKKSGWECSCWGRLLKN